MVGLFPEALLAVAAGDPVGQVAVDRVQSVAADQALCPDLWGTDSCERTWRCRSAACVAEGSLSIFLS